MSTSAARLSLTDSTGISEDAESAVHSRLSMRFSWPQKVKDEQRKDRVVAMVLPAETQLSPGVFLFFFDFLWPFQFVAVF
jgi:hypothetical protein